MGSPSRRGNLTLSARCRMNSLIVDAQNAPCRDSEDVYVILKVDNAAVISDARITQVIKNPLQYFWMAI